MPPSCTVGTSGSSALRFYAVIVCAGLASATLLRPLGLRIPLAPVYGHSVSAPVREPLNAPRSNSSPGWTSFDSRLERSSTR